MNFVIYSLALVALLPVQGAGSDAMDAIVGREMARQRVPETPEQYHGISVRHLLTHSAGAACGVMLYRGTGLPAAYQISLFSAHFNSLKPDQPPMLRLAAAGVLGQSRLDPSQLAILADAIATTGPLELSRLLPAIEAVSDEAAGARIVDALGQSPGLTSLTPESLRQALRAYPRSVWRQAAPLLARLESSSAEQAARLNGLAPLLERGDAAHGREIFFGQKAACTTCHTVESEGGHVGPDLSKIGAIRAKRDLLESIVFPSSTFARGFEPYTIATADGRTHTGIIARETTEALVLVSADRAEHRLPHAEIEAMTRSPVSIMPQGLDVQLTQQELTDLIAFLHSLK